MPPYAAPPASRALRLPEHVEVHSAECPLCGTVFDLPRRGPEGGRSARFGPSATPLMLDEVNADDRPIEGHSAITGQPEFSRRTGCPRAGQCAGVGERQAPDARRRVLGLAHGMLCGCTESFASVTGLDVGGGLVTGFFVLGVVLLAGFAALWRGATALAKRRNRLAVVTAGYVSFALSVWLVLGTLPWLIAATQRMGRWTTFRPREATSLLFIACDCIVAILADRLPQGARPSDSPRSARAFDDSDAPRRRSANGPRVPRRATIPGKDERPFWGPRCHSTDANLGRV